MPQSTSATFSRVERAGPGERDAMPDTRRRHPAESGARNHLQANSTPLEHAPLKFPELRDSMCSANQRILASEGSRGPRAPGDEYREPGVRCHEHRPLGVASQA